mgnify:CR=1 FL=1|jgi:hypothetical protein
MQAGLDPDKLVFLKETWAKTNRSRPRCRAPIDERLSRSVPYGHWKTTTFLAALRTSGMTAPLVVDRAINGDLFLAWVTQHLAPTLHENDVVIMDNLSAHKVAGMREAIESAGASDVLTAVQSGLEPDREHVFKVQVVLEISGRPNSRRLVENVRRFDRYVRGNRMLKLLPPLRAPL